MARPKPQGENITTQRIAALIQEKRYTQVAIAEMMDCAEGTVSRWVRGKTNMSAANLKKMASILETTTDYLRGHTNAKTADEQAQTEADEAAYWGIDADIPAYDPTEITGINSAEQSEAVSLQQSLGLLMTN